MVLREDTYLIAFCARKSRTGLPAHGRDLALLLVAIARRAVGILHRHRITSGLSMLLVLFQIGTVHTCRRRTYRTAGRDSLGLATLIVANFAQVSWHCPSKLCILSPRRADVHDLDDNHPTPFFYLYRYAMRHLIKSTRRGRYILGTAILLFQAPLTASRLSQLVAFQGGAVTWFCRSLLAGPAYSGAAGSVLS